MLSKAAIFNQSSGEIAPPGPTLGPELVGNGGFDNTNDWKFDRAGWEISGGTANVTNAASEQYSSIFQTQIISDSSPVLYRLVVTTLNGNYSGGLQVLLGDFNTKATITEDGIHTFDILSGTSATYLMFRVNPNNSFEGSIDNVSLKEIL